MKNEEEIMESVYTDMTDSELKVAKYLRELDLWWRFESPVFVYDEKDRPRVWTPDFYIPKLGMHIEVCGSEGFDYKYKEKIYKENGYHVIFLHVYKDPEKWKNYLVKTIMEIEDSRHSEVMKMIKHKIA